MRKPRIQIREWCVLQKVVKRSLCHEWRWCSHLKMQWSALVHTPVCRPWKTLQIDAISCGLCRRWGSENEPRRRIGWRNGSFWQVLCWISHVWKEILTKLSSDSQSAWKIALDSIFFEKIRGTSFFIEKSIGNQDVVYRKSENTERIRLIFELDRDIDGTMLCTKFEGCTAIISGVIVLMAGRTYWPIFECTHFLSTQKREKKLRRAASRIRTYAGEPIWFRVRRLNHSAIAALSLSLSLLLRNWRRWSWLIALLSSPRTCDLFSFSWE